LKIYDFGARKKHVGKTSYKHFAARFKTVTAGSMTTVLRLPV
jgi:hypothetical protein